MKKPPTASLALTPIALALLLIMTGLPLYGLSVATKADDAAHPNRVLGTSDTLTNHDLYNGGSESASDVVYGFTPTNSSSPLNFTAYYMSPTHKTPTDDVPSYDPSGPQHALSWQVNQALITPTGWTHIGYSIGNDVADCDPTVSGGTITLLANGDPVYSLDTTNVSWCGQDTIATPAAAQHGMMDGPGEPMTATISALGRRTVYVDVRVGTTDQPLSPEELLPRLMEREDGDPSPDFDETFTLNTEELDGQELQPGREPIEYRFDGSATDGATFLGVAVVMRNPGDRQVLARSFFARAVNDEGTHPPTPSPAPPPTDTPGPTDTPVTPTDTPTPTDAPTPDGPTPPPPVACDGVEGKVPGAVLTQALANPTGISGYGERCYPSQPVSPFNPLRRTLDLQNSNRPYHPIYNPLVFTCGC